MAGVCVKSSCLVGMSSDPTSMSKLELSPLDLQALLMDAIHRGILFHKPQFEEIDQDFINRLKNSLSQNLDFFPLLAGRLATTTNDDDTTSFFVDCNNKGVQFTHAVATGVSISNILESKYVPEIVSSFFALSGIPNYEGVSKPLVGVQVTELADGIFIAVTANHVVVDGISFWHFFNSWSEISRGLDKISKPPVFERWFPINVDRPIRLLPLEKDQGPRLIRSPMLVRVFHASKESLSKLKAKANSEAGTDKISSLQALSAHLWRNCVRCRRQSPITDNIRCGEARLFMGVSARTRIPLAEGYFGNAAYGSGTAAIDEDELLQKGLGFAALKINEMVAMQTKETAIKRVEDWVENPRFPQIGGFAFRITSSPRHDVYGNDFGWGKPIAVRSGNTQKYDGKVTVFPAVDGGIDAEVGLPAEVLQAMVGDAEFMEAFTF